MWNNISWKYRKKITIDRTKISGSSALVNFPVLIDHTDPDVFANAQVTGGDIFFTDVLGNKLSHEIEKYNVSTSRLTAWVKIPSLPTTADTVIYIYWGNPGASDQQDVVNTWNSNFKLVAHANESSGVAINDSTSNNNDLTKTSANAPAPTNNGIIGPGQSFAGSESIVGASAPSLPVNGSWLIDFWVKPTSYTNGLDNNGTGTYFLDRTAVTNGLTSIKAIADRYSWQKRYDDASGLGAINGALGPIVNGQAVKITLIRNYNSTLELRINGVSVGTAVDGTQALTVPIPKMGRHQGDGAGTGMIGLGDELRYVATNYSADWSLTEYRNQSSPQTFYSLGTKETRAAIRKYFYYKIYDDGIYVNTWTKEVISEPRFRSTINGGAGELNITLARDFDDFGEDEDVKLNNRVECYVVDKDNPDGLLLYAGYISGYRPIISREAERVEITVLSFLTELQRMILTDGSGLTTLTYNSYDPSEILRDVITKYRARGGQILYTAASIKNTNTTVSYTFQANTVKEALDKIIELAPVGWYWRVDPDGVIYFANKNAFADHTFTLGLDVENLETFRRIEDIINRVLVVGAGSPSLFRKYENTGSQGSYGLYEEKIVDQRISVVATASIIANREIDSKKDPEIRSIFTIIDNNGPRPRGYNVESVKPGQTLKVKGLRGATRTISLWDVALWDTDVWDQTLTTSAADVIQILSVDYDVDSIRIEASSRLPQIAKRIEDVQRNLEVTQSQDVPTSPS